MTFRNLGLPPTTSFYPAWPKVLVEKVDAALCMAWDRVRHHHPNVIATGDEDRITDQLKTELVALRKANTPAGFNEATFQLPVRDAKLRDGSGTSIDTTPDLTLYLNGSRMGAEDQQFDALFFECKVLTKGKGLHLYDKKGMGRFTSGWYAAKMPHAGLIAYALDGKFTCPMTSLTPYLTTKARKSTKTNAQLLRCRRPPAKVLAAPGPMAADIAETVHGRLIRRARSPVPDIALRHLWLLC